MVMSMTVIFPAPDDEDTTMVISRNVKAWMAQRGVTQVQLGAAMKLSQAVISNRLRGRTPWDATDIDKLRRIFGVSAAALVTATELPRLDSNQQPADSPSGLVARVARVVQLRPARTAAAG